jgi:ElaB/YqjD/DUF883 family membrane-anchored ribosome-binding protein
MSLENGATRAQAPSEGVGGKGAGASEELLRELKELLDEMAEIADSGSWALKEIQRIQKLLERLERAGEEERGKLVNGIARLLEDVEDVLNEMVATAEVAARCLRENYFRSSARRQPSSR